MVRLGRAQRLPQLPQARSHQFQSQLDGRLTALLLVGGPHRRPLRIAEQRQIAGTGDVALGVFARGSHIQHGTGGRQERFDPLAPLSGHSACSGHA